MTVDIRIIHNSQTPIYMQIRNQLKARIIAGELPDGALLPSERVMAKTAGVHRNTIIKAYNELKADGLIVAHQGLGYRIVRPGNTAGPDRHGGIPWLHLFKDAFAELEMSFENYFSRTYSAKCISFAGGIVPDEAYDKDDIRKIMTGLAASDLDAICSYAPYKGVLPLRQNLSAFLRDKGINAQPGEILVMSETNQIIDYLVELMIRPGDAVLTEEPVSPDVIRELSLAGARHLTMPMDSQGMVLEGMEALLLAHRPKFIYVNSSYQDPTGILMSQRRRQELLELSLRHHIPIIEDDCASGLRYEGEPVRSLKSMDRWGHVIYIYSFALTFAPGVRLAFAVAPKPVLKRLGYLVSTHLMSVDSLSQNLMSLYLEQGLYDKNLQAIRELYRRKRDRLCGRLEEARALGVVFEKPAGGVYVWCRLPETMRLRTLVANSARRGVAFIPGQLFYPSGTRGESFIRLNYSYPKEDQIDEGADRLLEAMRDSIHLGSTDGGPG